MSKNNRFLNEGVRGKKMLSMLGVTLDSSLTKSNNSNAASDSVHVRDVPYSQECKYPRQL